jgi:hypothetical protein
MIDVVVDDDEMDGKRRLWNDCRFFEYTMEIRK